MWGQYVTHCYVSVIALLGGVSKIKLTPQTSKLIRWTRRMMVLIWPQDVGCLWQGTSSESNTWCLHEIVCALFSFSSTLQNVILLYYCRLWLCGHLERLTVILTTYVCLSLHLILWNREHAQNLDWSLRMPTCCQENEKNLLMLARG